MLGDFDDPTAPLLIRIGVCFPVGALDVVDLLLHLPTITPVEKAEAFSDEVIAAILLTLFDLYKGGFTPLIILLKEDADVFKADKDGSLDKWFGFWYFPLNRGSLFFRVTTAFRP